MKLDKRVALVTGGASGIGKACAQRFADEGAVVVVVDLDAEKGEAFAASLPGGKFIRADVTVAAEVERMVAETVQMHGRLDILMNNAGIDGHQAPTHESTLDNWHNVMKVNMDGVYYGLKYGIAQMVKQGGGVVLNTSSTVGLVAFGNIPPYSASKAGVIGLTRAAAIEYAKQGIRVNAICPSVVRTPLVDHFIKTSDDPAATEARFANLNPIPGLIPLDAVANAALFLVSDDSAFITGHALPIDGGYVAQ
jgi:NAD(P)-dependent dehydrogenase (short-subunit alcohol dehydrogenase family)